MRQSNPVVEAFVVIEPIRQSRGEFHKEHRFEELAPARAAAQKFADRVGRPIEVRRWAPTTAAADMPVLETLSPATSCSCRRTANPSEQMRVIVTKGADGRWFPALVTLDAAGKLYKSVALGPPTKSSFEIAHGQAKKLAKQFGLELEVHGVAEEPDAREKNPGKPSIVPLLQTKAQSFRKLAEQLLERFPKLPPAVLLQVDAGELVRLELEAGRVKAAKVGRRALAGLRKRLNEALRVLEDERAALPGAGRAVHSKRKGGRRMGDIKAKPDREAPAERRAALSAEDEELLNWKPPTGRIELKDVEPVDLGVELTDEIINAAKADGRR